MSTSHLCRRCGRWHDVTAPCDRTSALRSLLTATADQQRVADQLEAISLARYRMNRLGGR
jgi:hypothetical protein